MPSEQPPSVWDDNDGTGEMCDTPAQGATDEEIAKGKQALSDQSVSLFVLKWADDDPCGLRVVMKHEASGTYTINLSRLYTRLDHEIAARREAEEDAAILASIIIDLDNEEEPTDERKREAKGIAKRRYEWFEQNYGS